MPGLDAAFATHVQSLTESLRTIVEGAPPALPGWLTELRRVFGADATLACGFEAAAGAPRVAMAFGSGLPVHVFRAALDEVMRERPRDWGPFDPVSPDRRQRDRVLTVPDLQRITGSATNPVVERVLPRAGLARAHQMRVLVCDGPRLLAWVGAFRGDAFSDAERAALQALVAPVRRRLVVGRLLAFGPVAIVALERCLDRCAHAAFVVDAEGAPQLENAAGRAALARAPEEVRARLRRAARGGPSQGADMVLELSGRGLPRHALVLFAEDLSAPGRRTAALAAAWDLPPRQALVLERVARGDSNKEIAAALACAESSVERHVTALLRRAGCTSRAALVARFWTAPLGGLAGPPSIERRAG